jgi:hypothetical protein
LLGLGGANVAAGLLSGMVVNGSLSKTAVPPRGPVALGRDIGQVRDILHSVIENPAIAHFYPTVQAAVAAAGK